MSRTSSRRLKRGPSSVDEERNIAMISRIAEQGKYIIVALRSGHWIKNVFLFAPLIFSGHFRNPADTIHSIIGFVIFSMVASSVYLFNDLIDREQDAQSGVARDRPIAAGKLAPATAVLVALILQASAIVGALYLDAVFLFWLVLYSVNNVAYSLYVKNKVIADVISIAVGFVIRILAGATLIGVEPSHWLLVCTFSLSLLLGFGKRRAELINARGVKVVSRVYTEEKLDHMMAVSTAITLLSYMLYAVSPESITRFNGNTLIYSVPFVVYGVFRFVAKIQEGKCNDPVHLVYSDPISALNVFVWAMVVFSVVARAYLKF
jgi:decaprenyl-phosphate phosphoribosyltransferase